MASFTNQTKNTASYSNLSKNTSIWDSLGTDLLLQEDGFFLLLESSDRIILEQSGSIGSSWTNLTKN